MRRAGLFLGLLLALAVASAVAGGAWLFATEAGLRWAVARAIRAHRAASSPSKAVRGTLASEVSITRLRYGDDGIDIDAQDVRARGSALALLRGKLGIEPLRIARCASRLRMPRRRREGPAAFEAAPRHPAGARAGRAAGSAHGDGEELLTKLRLAHLASTRARFRSRDRSMRPDERFPASVAFEASGSLAKSSPRRYDARVAEVPLRAKLELAPREALPVRSLEARLGPLDPARLDMRIPEARLELELRAQARRGAVSRPRSASPTPVPGPLDAGALPVSALRARFSSADPASAVLEQLHVELSGGAVLEGRGKLEQMRPMQADLRVRDLDLRALRTNLRRTSLGGDVTDGDLARGAVGSRRAGPARSCIEAHVERAGDMIEVRALRATTAGGEVRGDGRLRLVEPLRVQARLQLERIDPSAFGDFPPGSISGEVEGEGTLGAEPQLDARWRIRESILLHEPLESEGRARFSRERAEGVQARARLGTVRATARGSLGRKGDRSPGHCAWTSFRRSIPGSPGGSRRAARSPERCPIRRSTPSPARPPCGCPATAASAHGRCA
jgi:hypothetical protein